METFQADSDETIRTFINRYPLAVSFFQQDGDLEQKLSLTLEEYCRQQDIKLEELEAGLQNHMAEVAQPDADCSIPCLPGFCPEDPRFWLIIGVFMVVLVTVLWLVDIPALIGF